MLVLWLGHLHSASEIGQQKSMPDSCLLFKLRCYTEQVASNLGPRTML
jgi:hypothetical protein